MNKEYIIGVDLGSNKMGVSRADKLNLYAWPLKLIYFINNDYENGAFELTKLIVEKNVTKCVVGVAYHLDNRISQQAKNTFFFIKHLQNLNKNLTIIKQDERYSTSYAKKIYQNSDTLKKNKKTFREQKDILSACAILQIFLNKLK